MLGYKYQPTILSVLLIKNIEGLHKAKQWINNIHFLVDNVIQKKIDIYVKKV